MRATQVFRAFVGRSIARLFPREGGGAAARAGAGRRLAAGPGPRRATSRRRASGICWSCRARTSRWCWRRSSALGVAAAAHAVAAVRSGVGTVVFFVVMTGAEPSVMRAGVMATTRAGGRADRAGRAPPARSWPAAVLCSWSLDPWLVWSIGFQLSVAATAGMVAMATPLGERLGGSCRRRSRSLPARRSPRSSASRRCCCSISTRCRASRSSRTSRRSLRSRPRCCSGSRRRRWGSCSVPLGRLVAFVALIPMRYLELVADRLAKAPVAYVTSGGGPLVLIVGGGVRGRARMVAASAAGGRRGRRSCVVVAIAPARRLVVGAGRRAARRRSSCGSSTSGRAMPRS